MRIKRTDIRPNGPPPRLGLKAASPADEDCNSNTSLTGSQQSAQDDAHTDNSDYLWFLDYNPLFRDGSCHHTSVLSSVSASYKGIGDLTSRFEFTSRYNDLARDLDANLAEADMESFKTEDIHALLMTDLQHDIVQHNERTHDGDESTAGSINTMSICKSELLFSPVKEPTHGVHFSVDSLDCELPSERELILTCQANKDNYTIAFEGSLLYDDEAEHIEMAVNSNIDNKREEREVEERTRRNLELLEKCDKLSSSMARSEQGFTTWSKIKKDTGQSPLRRHGSGNNNEESEESSEIEEVNSSVIKSQSLPNLFRKMATSSLHSAALSNSTIDSFTHATHQRLSGAGACMKVYDVAHNANCITRSHGSQHSEPMSTSSTENQSSSDKSQPKPFNLVKLFMKQKSMSNEGIVSMEQLERSECWPSSSGGESDSFGADSKTKHMRKMEKLPKMSISEDGSGQDETDFTIATQTPGIYEPNILNTTQTLTCNRVYEATLIEEEENSETGNIDNLDNRVLSDSESNLYATVNKPQVRRNVNNNNSPLRVRNVNRRSCSSQSSATSISISSCSDSDGTQLTRMHRLIHKGHCDNRATSTQVQVEMVDRSMQTSNIGASYNTNYRDVVRVVEPSFLQKLKEGDCQKPVYVLYPNYTLPDISFLNGRPNIYLNPQKVTLTPSSKKSRNTENKGKRPFSCNDVELLRKKGFSHIRDWDSLNFLLPNECRQMLSEVPEIMHKVSKESPHGRDKYCGISPSTKAKSRPMSCDCNNLTGYHPTNVSSSSSTATQPSSGYRGSSTMLTDSSAQNSPAPGNFNPLFVYRYDSATSSEASYADKMNPTIPKRSLSLADQQRLLKGPELAPPRPPLPKGILRKSMDKTRKSGASAKRYSMFEMEEYLQDPIACVTAGTEHKTAKRRSLQEPYYLQKHNSEERRKNNDVAAKRLSQQFLDAADKDADYHEYYHDEGVGTESSLESGKSNEAKYHRPQTPPLPRPRTKKLEYIEFPPPGALISSLELQQLEEYLEQSGFSCDNMDEWDQNQVQKGKNLAEMPICEEGETTPEEYGSPKRDLNTTRCGSFDISQKRALVSSVTDAVELLIQHFSPATDQAELAVLGDSSQSPICAKVALNALCPALYAIFRDGLRENIETSFGAVNNSVWQMVEATARQGPITRSLNELVMKINSEDAVTEGLVKFNAFLLGLLNSHSVDAWVSYMRTRESALRKHYEPESLLRLGCSGEPGCRALLDTLVASLEPLKLLPFRLHLMFEMRELHRSFKRIESEVRAATRLESSGDEASGSRPPSGAGSGQSNGGKFRRLQLKWELLSNGDSSPSTPPGVSETSPASSRGSRIPRPVTSPVRPPGPPSSPAKPTASPHQRGIPVAVRKGSSPTTPSPRQPISSTPKRSIPSRASRVEQAGGAAPRPSSLPYGRTGSATATARRRAVSSSLGRADRSPTATAVAAKKSKPKMVRTLWHRLPSDSGHLAFSEGERLRLVLEVDDQYLLCCRGEHKGLVPRDAVILENSLGRL